MGKRLIVKGADFSANAIPENGPIITPPTPSKVNLWRPNVVDGKAVMTDGYFTTSQIYENKGLKSAGSNHCFMFTCIQIDEPGTYEWRHSINGKVNGGNGAGLYGALSWRRMINPTAAASWVGGDETRTKEITGCRRIEWPEGEDGPLMLMIWFVADVGTDATAEANYNAGVSGYLTRAQVAQCTLYKVD